jgi:excisionase family DNA binding protein
MIVLDGDEFLTVEEAATRLGIKPASLYAYVSRGVIRSYRQGIKRQRLYRRAEVEALLRVAPAGGPAPASPAPPDRDRARKRRVPDIPLAESWIRE